MPWTPEQEQELEEEEMVAQCIAIAEMHEEMLTGLYERELKYGEVRKPPHYSRITRKPVKASLGGGRTASRLST